MERFILRFLAGFLAALALLGTKSHVSALEGGLRTTREKLSNDGHGTLEDVHKVPNEAAIAGADAAAVFAAWDPAVRRSLEEAPTRALAKRMPAHLSTNDIQRQLWGWVSRAWQKTKEAAVSIATKVAEVVEKAVVVVTNVVESAAKVVVTVVRTAKCVEDTTAMLNVTGAVDCIVDGAKEVVEEVQHAINETKNGLEEIANDARDIVDDVKDTFEDVKGDIEDGIEDTKEDIEVGIGEIVDDAKAIIEKTKQDIQEGIKAEEKELQKAIKCVEKGVGEITEQVQGLLGEQAVAQIKDEVTEATDFIGEGIERAKKILLDANNEEQEMLQELLDKDKIAEELKQQALDSGDEALMKQAEDAAKEVEEFAKMVTKKMKETEAMLEKADKTANKALKDAVKVEKNLMSEEGNPKFIVVAEGISPSIFDTQEAAEAAAALEEMEGNTSMIVKKAMGVVKPMKETYVGPPGEARTDFLHKALAAARATVKKEDPDSDSDDEDEDLEDEL